MIHNRFKVKFTRFSPVEFQRFLEQILKKTIRGFERVSIYGGDKGADGVIRMNNSVCTVFQIYAPETNVTNTQILNKVRDDLGKALDNWPSLQKWIFIYRHRTGLPSIPADILKGLQDISKKNGVKIDIWSEDELWERFETLDEHTQVLLLGATSLRRVYRWQSQELNVQVSESTRRLVLDHVDDTCNDTRLTKWEDTVLLLVKLMKAEIALLPTKSNESKYSSELQRVESLFRESLMFLLATACEEKDWRKASVIVKGIDTALRFLSEVEKEEYFANWIGDLRGLYFNYVNYLLIDSAKRKSHDLDLFNFIESFSRIMVRPLEEALKIGGSTFSLGFGMNVLTPILLDRLDGLREFHTSDDDFASPTSLSVFLRPAIVSIPNLMQLVRDLPKNEPDILRFWDSLEAIVYSLLVTLRDRDELDSLDRFSLSMILNEPSLLKLFVARNHLVDLANYERRVALDKILVPIHRTLKSKSENFDNQEIVNIFENSLEGFKIQRDVYDAVAWFLLQICVDCVKLLNEKKRIQCAISLVKEVFRKEIEVVEIRKIVYIFEMLGWLSLKANLNVVEYFKEEICKIDERIPEIREGLEIISDYRPPLQDRESEFDLRPVQLYEKWEIDASKKALALIDDFFQQSN